jgi:hypothetical protein
MTRYYIAPEPIAQKECDRLNEKETNQNEYRSKVSG